MDKALLIYFILLAVTIAAIRFAFYCLKKAGEAYLYAAQLTSEQSLRRKLSRKAVLAGNKAAYPIYALSNPTEFDSHKPMKPFKFKGVRCIFTDYYIPTRYHNDISYEQGDFYEELLGFKDGKRNGYDFFMNCMETLEPEDDCVIMFMPCSKNWHYRKRFSALNDFLEDYYPESSNGYNFITYTGERESLHLTKDRTKKSLEQNYYINCDLTGKKVVVVDDLFTTGSSIFDFKKQIEKKGGKVSYALFLGKTFQMPDKFDIWFTAWCNTRGD
ncbi:phosphoribosyltransferase [Bacteroides sp. OttesenSCG-928-D19]|nr:phosphoribosyltransferase [Bacteroides sp. OttesenSCG-928-D19]